MTSALALLGLLVVGALGPETECAPRVHVVLDDCVEHEPDALEPLLGLEFGPAVHVAVSRAGESASLDLGSSRVEIGCGELGLILALDDAVTDKTMRRSSQLEPGGGDWGRRALALAIVEFVRASWLELELADEPARDQPIVALPNAARPPPPAASVMREAKTLAIRPPRPWTLSLGPRVEVATEDVAIFVGGQLRVLHQPRRRLAWTIAAAGLHARPRVGLGVLGVTLARLSPALLAVLQRRSFALAGGLGTNVGLAHLRGLPAPDSGYEGERFTRVAAGAFALGRATLELPHDLRLAVELELGAAYRPVVALADGEPEFTLSGVWVAGGLELGFVLAHR